MWPGTKKNSLKCQFFEIEISVDVYGLLLYLAEIHLLKNLESEGAKKSEYWENRL